MSSAFDPQPKDDKQKFPIREGQGDESSIRADGEKSKKSESENYPDLPEEDTKQNLEDTQHQNQDEYDDEEADKMNTSE